MALDPHYVTTVDLLPYLVDKDTGQPLAGGYINFYQDDSRTTPKAVYELTGSPPNYTYTALPNPIQLSATGTIVDSSGNQCALYYYPYDESQPDDPPLQLYYIEVFNSLGVAQFTREAWPNITPETSPANSSNNTIVNLLSNPQFADVLFDPDTGLNINYSSGSLTTSYVTIAPGWDLVYSYNGSGTINVSRTSVVGNLNYPTNPPYLLTITPGANLVNKGLYLRQRLYNTPAIWANPPGAETAYLVTNALVGPGNGTQGNSILVQYSPSSPTNGSGTTTLLDVTNTTLTYSEFSQCYPLPPSNSSDNSDVGYVDIIVYVSNSGYPTTISSLQVAFLAAPVPINTVNFEQTPVNRQIDELFHYYNPLLQAKPADSYLIGWDFPYNPAQINGDTVGTQDLGANTSYYAWDQTIIYQSVTSAVSISRATDGDMLIQCNVPSAQIAVIQYLDQKTARDLLYNRLSVNMVVTSHYPEVISGKITLWYTTDVSIVYAANTSLVTGLDSTGFPTLQGNWTQVTRSGLGDAVFNINGFPSGPFSGPSNHGFSGWEDDTNGYNTATFFAIVIGTQTITNVAPSKLYFHSVSLVPGDIPCLPNPKTITQTLADCQLFYERSYEVGTATGTMTQNNEIFVPQPISQYINGSTNYVVPFYGPFQLNYKQTKRTNSPTLTFYSPNDGSVGNVYYEFYEVAVAIIAQNTPISGMTSIWDALDIDSDRASFRLLTATSQNKVSTGSPYAVAGFVGTAYIIFHYTNDARLGIVD